MISIEMNKMLNAQAGAERWSSYLYHGMALKAIDLGYRGVGHWFEVQSDEELEHSHLIERYLQAQQSPVVLKSIDGVCSDWTSPLEMFRVALEHERSVTKMIDNLMSRAKNENDFATSTMLLWFVNEQVEEEEQCADYVQQFENAANVPCCFMQIDFELQKRKPHEREQ